MASSTMKAVLMATLLISVACLVSGFAPGPSGAFLASGHLHKATCTSIPLRHSISSPVLRTGTLPLMAKSEDASDETVEETTETQEEEAPAEPEVMPRTGPQLFLSHSDTSCVYASHMQFRATFVHKYVLHLVCRWKA